jgi:flagellar protein FliL
MSAPTPAATTDVPAQAAPRGKKKLLVMGLAGALVLAAGGGGGAFWWTQKKAAERAAAEADAEDGAAAAPADDKKAARPGPPVFVVLEPFTVNLADRDAERYAQVGITLEVDDAKVGDQVKQYMPAVRNNILLVLADKTAAELHAREGKRKLADEVLREAVRALGGDDAAAEPLRAVHFSNFIIQ